MCNILQFLTLSILATPFWIQNNFGKSVTTDQIIFHILAGLETIEGTDSSLFFSFFVEILLAPLIAFAILKFSFRRLNGGWLTNLIAKKCKLVSSISLLIAIIFLGIQINAGEYIENLLGEDHLSQIYKNPTTLTFETPKIKKNLILIYVESLQSNLIDPVNNRSLTEQIDNLAGLKIKEFYQAPGTGWSMAGMVSSQCSIPLKSYFYEDALRTKATYMPSLICIGDVLHQAGYDQTFYVGPDLKFAGMDKFYLNHGFQNAYGKWGSINKF